MFFLSEWISDVLKNHVHTEIYQNRSINSVQIETYMFLVLILIIAQTKIRRLQLGRLSDETVKINVAHAFEEY